jgi:predicted metal-dependent enzyme (double-stranded beta helix superfamily)
VGDISSDDAISAFMADAAAIVAVDGPGPAAFARIGDRLRRLAGDAHLLDEVRLAGLHDWAASATIAGRHGDGSVLMIARFPEEAPTPVHNHNSWGVVHVLRGRDRYERWSRLDDGAEPARADLRLEEELALGTGDVVWFDGPPQDLHAQQGVGGPVWELVYFGRDPNAAPRAYFDPATGGVTYADAAG